MNQQLPFDITEDPKLLSRLTSFSEQVYRDLLACQKGSMTEKQFRARYMVTKAVLCLDMTGFTKSILKNKGLASFYRILDMQKICMPVFQQHNAHIIHAFADNFAVTFKHPQQALDSAFAVHERVKVYNKVNQKKGDIIQCCIGIGYGGLYEIGHDKAMGIEMNMASKLGEDIAKGAETLVTEKVYKILKDYIEYHFIRQTHDKVPFPFYCARREKKNG